MQFTSSNPLRQQNSCAVIMRLAGLLCGPLDDHHRQVVNSTLHNSQNMLQSPRERIHGLGSTIV